MIKNYLKIAFRTLVRDKAFSFLNIVGLAVGLASVIMIVAYVRYELSYDTSYSNHPFVYRLIQHGEDGDAIENSVAVEHRMAEVLQKEFPAIIATTEFGITPFETKIRGNVLKLNAIIGSADFFKLFDFKFISGNSTTAMRNLGSVVLTRTTAIRYFNTVNVVGKTIVAQDGHIKTITGVIADIPPNTHFEGDAVVTNDYPVRFPFSFENGVEYPQYVMLNRQADAAQLERQFNTIYKKYNFPKGVTIHLQNVDDIHFGSRYFSEYGKVSSIKYIYVFSSVALLILVIACINYVNLTTARSLSRASEIGVRKVLGALRSQLIFQFLTESFLFFFISTVLAVVLASAVWPVLSSQITLYTETISLFDPLTIAGILAILLVGGLLSGAYPAFFLSSLQPVKVLKGLSKFGINISLRRALVVLQFVISGALIICTMVVNKQMAYVNNADLGFNKSNLVRVYYSSRKETPEVYKHALLTNPDIMSVTMATLTIGKSTGWQSVKDPKDSTRQKRFDNLDVDMNFVKTMGITLLEGRGFSPDYALDGVGPDSVFHMSKGKSDDEIHRLRSSMPVMLNQAAVAALDLNNPVGKVLTSKTNGLQGTVIGIVKDFNDMSLHEQVNPTIIYCYPNNKFGSFYIRIAPNHTAQTLKFIGNQWKKLYPDKNFEFEFTDEMLQKLYATDQRLASLFGIFSTLAIIIACLGLFGLVSLTVQNRVKEIGIRKVLGAGVIDITRLISVDFLKLVLLSFVISSPIALYFMNKWLQDFAYRTQIEWWLFVVACVLAMLIAFATLSIQSVKAAMANPVKSLRSE